MLFEQVAHNLEINMVAVIGRNDLKLGPLCNLTDAGEGISGYRHTIETKEKIRLSLIGRNKGIERTNEVKEKISKANLGRILSEETKKELELQIKVKFYQVKHGNDADKQALVKFRGIKVKQMYILQKADKK